MTVPPTPCLGCQQDTELFPFTMAFQPVVDVQERKIEAYEALVRGPAGEGAGRVLAQVTDENRYAFDQACRVKAVSLASALGISCNLNINFLPNAVYEPKNCLRSTLAAAKEHDFPLNRLTFEIIEHEALTDSAHLLRIVTEYRRQGFKLALDDFGVGYSGLVRLAELAPDIVKIDRALIAHCDTTPARLTIIKNMVALGAALGTKIVAEGVETAAEFFTLRDAGVRYMQGFVLARPAFEVAVPVGEISWPQ
jgi:EAL domain-containing protein (putative c-di-GMP-specific phosphodiesterase class I)